ncbi:MAG: PAS domain-containing protein, partial [Candidatus Thorarchaeota archaeon]
MEYNGVKQSCSKIEKTQLFVQSQPHNSSLNPLTQQGLLVITINPFQVVFSNHSATQITGFDSDELNTLSKEQMLERFHPLDRRRLDEFFSNESTIMSSNVINSVRTQRKNGSSSVIDIKSTRVKIAGEHFNIIDFQKSDNRRFIENVIESLTHPFYVINATDYKILLANRAARLGNLSGIETCYGLTHRLDRPCHEFGHNCPLKEVVTKKLPISVEHEHYDDDGNLRIVEVHAYPI